jgi:hypothetical protein
MPVQPVSAMRGGEGDSGVDNLGRLRQKGLMRRGELANQSSEGKGSEDRGWKELGWAKREEGAGVVGLSVVGLVWFSLLIACLILFVWGGERSRGRDQSEGSGSADAVGEELGGVRLGMRCGAGPLAYAGDALSPRRNERRWQGGCSCLHRRQFCMINSYLYDY